MNKHLTTPAFHQELHDIGNAMLHEGRLLHDLAQGMRAWENLTGQKIALVDVEQLRSDATIDLPSAETITDLDDTPEPPALTEPQPAPEPEPEPDQGRASAPAPAPEAEPDQPAERVVVDVPSPLTLDDPQTLTEWQRKSAIEMSDKGFCPSHIAKELGCTTDDVGRFVRSKPRAVGDDKHPVRKGAWSEDEIEHLNWMRSDGKTLVQIGLALGRTQVAVRDKIKALDRQQQKDDLTSATTPVLKPEPVAPAVQIAPAPPPAPAPAPAPSPPPVVEPARLTNRQNELIDHLNKLPDTFAPEDDLYLAESLFQRVSIGIIADQLGCDEATVRGRFRAMQNDSIRNSKGVLTIDGQADLLVALRYRLE